MRWFKHLTSSSRDEKLCRVRDELGPAGYGFYWLVLEAIAEQMDERDKTHLTLSGKGWRKATGATPKSLARFLELCRELGLLLVEESGGLIRIDCPNLLKYRDEYTRKKRGAASLARRGSGPAPDQETEPEPKAEALPPPGLPLRGGGEFVLPDEALRELARAHPGTDLVRPLGDMRSWLAANPHRRPTRAGIMGFVHNWLAREKRPGPGLAGRGRDLERQAMARAILEQEDAEHGRGPEGVGQAEHPLPQETLR